MTLLLTLFLLSACDTAMAATPQASIAVTIDDLPFVGGLGPSDSRAAATRRILGALTQNGAPATGFVVCERVGGRGALEPWITARMEIGNHSTDHSRFDALTLDQWTGNVTSCRDKLAGYLGSPPRFFRYPFLQTGSTAERRDAGYAALRAMGHELAPVSIDTGEWTLVAPYVAALAQGDTALEKEIGEAYVEHILAATRHFRSLALATQGREIPHVLLLHANALAADFLGPLLEALAREPALVADQPAGIRFVTLDEALSDPVYKLSDRYAGKIGLSWLYRVDPAVPSPSGGIDASRAWSFDDGQTEALLRRFAKAPDTEPVRIDTDLVVKPLDTGSGPIRAWIVLDETPWPANSLLVETSGTGEGSGTLVLVGTPYTPEATGRLLTWIGIRFGHRPIVAINPHFHDDAAGGNAALVAAGARVIASTNTVRLIRERWGTSEAHALPTETFEEAAGLELHLGSDTVRIIHPGPAHAIDNVVVHFPEHNLLFGGCMLTGWDRIGNKADADMAAWPKAVERLMDLKADFVIPGHGDRTDRGLLENTLRVLAVEAPP